MLIFDIETEPLPDEELQALCPPFDPDEVKLGNTKDAEKIKAKVEAARANHFQHFKSGAALSAATGRVIAIGMYSTSSDQFWVLDTILRGETEVSVLQLWWNVVNKCIRQNAIMAGHNIYEFDLPFLVQRSWICGVAMPHGVVDLTGKWTNWHRLFLDTRKIWQLGTKCESNFHAVGRCIGTGGKCEGNHGAMFYELIRKDRESALRYLENDVRQPADWLRRFGVIE